MYYISISKTGTASVNAVFPPIPSNKPDGNGVASSAGSSTITDVALFTRKHVLQVSTYQVRCWSMNQTMSQFERSIYLFNNW